MNGNSRHQDQASQDAFIGRQRVDALAVERNGTGTSGSQAGEGEHQGRLSRRIRSDERNDLSGANLEIDAVQDLHWTVERIELVDAKQQSTPARDKL